MSQADEEQPLPAAEEAAILAALEAALRPSALADDVNERLIAMALEDPFAPASAEEQAESARLRDALEQGRAHEDAATLAALRVAFQQPAPVEPAVERAVRGALAARPRRANVVYAAFGGASALLAAAAAVVLFVGASRSEPTAASVVAQDATANAFAKPRSTAPLFADAFQTGDTTARMDLIASARARDLRDNRFTAWGVR